MSIDKVLNFLCYDLRPPLEHFLQKGQQSFSYIRSWLPPLLQNSSNRSPIKSNDPPRQLEPNQEEAGSRKNKNEILQERSQQIWESAKKGADKQEWLEKNELSKLMFYWMAVGGDIISEDPFENFKFYVDTQAQRQVDLERCMELWYSLSKDEQMPFRFEACLARIASGKINLFNEREIRDYMTRFE